MSQVPDVRIVMPARPEGVGVVRQALGGVADTLAFDSSVVSDMKTAVTEACTNVVVHAYADRDEPGMLQVDMFAESGGLTVVVRDQGKGVYPRPVGDSPALGLGLPLIAALSDAYELRGSGHDGTEVRMSFNFDRVSDPATEHPIEEYWQPEG